ncbi:MAG: hypothetical protein HXY28_15000 [Hydrogenophilaceae bacterium]|jgi:hypothetical protein|nr:hypothetical protein [Hydrogenophilaceae bacterium]
MSAFVRAFETGALDPRSFTHRAHVETAHALLRAAPFLDAAQRYMHGIAQLAARAGAPEKANLTITLAFLSAIAERMGDNEDAGALFLRHPELLEKDFLMRWYTRERLAEPRARTMLLLP